MAASITRRVVCAGVIAGFSALALIANPAIGSATVTCSSTVTNSATTITVALHDIAATEALNHCEAQTFPFDTPVYDKTTSVDEIEYADISLSWVRRTRYLIGYRMFQRFVDTVEDLECRV